MYTAQHNTEKILEYGNLGGVCQGCGVNLSYWLHYKLCDRCLQGLPVLRELGQPR